MSIYLKQRNNDYHTIYTKARVMNKCHVVSKPIGLQYYLSVFSHPVHTHCIALPHHHQATTPEPKPRTKTQLNLIHNNCCKSFMTLYCLLLLGTRNSAG